MTNWPGRGGGARWRDGVWPDIALAAAVTLGGQLELASSGQQGWRGLEHGLLLFAQTSPVAGRRIAPAAAATVSATALAAEAVITVPTNTLSGLLAGLILIYSLGRHSSGRRLVCATALIVGTLALHLLRLPGWQASDLAFGLVFSGAAWFGGRTLRRRETERRRAAAEAASAQHAASAALEAAVVEERSRIARELHDVVAHGMGVMVVQAAAAEHLLGLDPASAREPLTTVRETGQGALAEMRRLLGLLRDGADSGAGPPQPGLGDLPGLAARLRESGMKLTLEQSLTGPLEPGLELCAYRIVQEALTNALKHAPGAAVTVRITREHDTLVLVIANTAGTAAQPAADGNGHGLIGMRERVRVYGGTLEAAPQADGSFLVRASLRTESTT